MPSSSSPTRSYFHISLLLLLLLQSCAAFSMNLPKANGSAARNWVRGSAIAAGSFGAVSLALDRSSGERFAVKSVSLASSPASVHSLENEIAILKSLDSPYVVGYLDDDVTQEPRLGACRNLHTEYMPGGTAARCRPMGEPELRAYARCVALALGYLHVAAGVVHCDVKGGNVLLGGSPGVAKLADFGSAMRISDASGGGGSDECWFRGTPLWMAPEVVRGERPGPESDVWSLGCTVIEMATGRQPWTGSAPMDTAAALFKIGYGEELPEFPRGLSESGWDFLDKCLRRKAEERWTAEQLLKHPFLTESDAAAEWSPRSVLDWTRSEFTDGDGEGSGMSCSSVPNSFSVLSSAAERVKALASEQTAALTWNAAGWETVRCAGEDLDSAADVGAEHCADEKAGEQIGGCCDRRNLESDDWNGEDVTCGARGAVVLMADAVSCSAPRSSSSLCCPCLRFCRHPRYWCRGASGRRNGVGEELALSWCDLLFQLMAVCKMLKCPSPLTDDWFPFPTYFMSNVKKKFHNLFSSEIFTMLPFLNSLFFFFSVQKSLPMQQYLHGRVE